MIHRFSDFANINVLDGEKKQISKIIGKEITIIGFKITPSKKNSGRCLKLQYKLDNEIYITFTGSNILIDKYKKEIPFITTIKQVGSYYSFS